MAIEAGLDGQPKAKIIRNAALELKSSQALAVLHELQEDQAIPAVLRATFPSASFDLAYFISFPDLALVIW